MLRIGEELVTARVLPMNFRLLVFPRALWLACLLAVALALPSVSAGFYFDDQLAVLRLEGIAPDPAPGPWQLYTFATGEPGQRQLIVDRGPLPWWTHDELRLSFFRPLSSALLAFDHAIAGRHPLPYHLHAIAWYVAAVIASAMLLRRLLPEREAALATLLFAMSPGHWMLAAWPSARHVAVSGVFALMAIGAHLRARTRAQPLSLGALACTVLALAAGETGLGVFAYVAAYEVIGRREAIALRLQALVPWGTLFLAYATLYKALGFGARASGAYLDPIGQPAEYLALLPSRLAVYTEAALVGVPSVLSAIMPKSTPILAALGAAAAIALALLFRRAWLTLAPELRRTLAWLLTGAALAVLPGAAGFPGDRVLFLTNIGVTSALAIVLLHAGARVDRATPVWRLPAARTGIGLFGLLHIVVAPLLFAASAKKLASVSHTAMDVAARAEIPARDGVNVVGIGMSDPILSMYLASELWLAPRPEPRPRVVRPLSGAPCDHIVKRTDDRTLEITLVKGTLFDDLFTSFVRPNDAPLRAGHVVSLGTWIVRIVDDDAGRPTRFAVTFDRSVDDPSLAFVVWHDGALRAFTAPPVGHEVTVKHEAGPMGI
ncbi:hypothetical protein LVJ94_50735 [Pendulispora rubella]|uniref:Uncharacterized protein n=1 Tax=Pendulispora rubella TaxID=2741070 RepID=A0ABZ2L5S2_9BACT